MEKRTVLATVRNAKGDAVKIKRSCEFYTSQDKLSAEMIANANAGLKLVHQRQMRDSYAVKTGTKKTTSGGQAVDLSNVESI